MIAIIDLKKKIFLMSDIQGLKIQGAWWSFQKFFVGGQYWCKNYLGGFWVL